MNRRAFIQLFSALPFIGVPAISVAMQSESNVVRYKLTFDDWSHLINVQRRRKEMLHGREDEQLKKYTIKPDGRIELFYSRKNVDPLFSSSSFLIPISIAYAASRIENINTGQILKDRYK